MHAALDHEVWIFWAKHPALCGLWPPHPPLCFFTLRAGVNTSAPACCTDFTQPRQMVLTLRCTLAPAPGTLGKSFRALATLSASTCTRYKHRCSGMCAGMRARTSKWMQRRAAAKMQTTKKQTWENAKTSNVHERFCLHRRVKNLNLNKSTTNNF